MASRKLTALPTATEVTTSDKIYIVDVSDTTESPQGTSKQATVEKVLNSIESGTYTPTISNITDSATVDFISALYFRCGNVVSGVFKVDVFLDAGSNSCSFDFTTPITTAFSNRNQLLCTCNYISPLLSIDGESVIGQSKGNVSIQSANNGDSLEALSIAFQFLIV